MVFDGLIFGAGGPRVDRGRLSLVFGSGYYLKTMMCDVSRTWNLDIRQWWQLDITWCCFPPIYFTYSLPFYLKSGMLNFGGSIGRNEHNIHKHVFNLCRTT